MRNLTLLISALFVFGCGKKATEPAPAANPVHLKTFGSTTYDHNVATEQGYVTLNIEDLPEGVEADIATVTGTTPFTTSLSFETHNALPGQHTIKLVSYKDGKTGDFVITEIQLDVQPLDEAEHNRLFYQWTERDDHKLYTADESGKGFNHPAILTMNDDAKLFIQKLPVYYEHHEMYSVTHTAADDVSLPLLVNCESGELSIPETTVLSSKGESYTVSGKGEIDYGEDYTTTDDKFELTYTTGKQTMKLTGVLR